MPTERVTEEEPTPIDGQTPYRNYKFKKRWREAIIWNSDGLRGKINNCVEGSFNRMLTLIKKELTGTQALVIERDDRLNQDSPYNMHTFMCSSFYIHLHCELAYIYMVDFAFNNCPIEKQLRSILDSYLMQDRTKEKVLKPDFNTFYGNLLAFQDKKHHYLL